jgi:CHAD domain-containing protein
MTYRDAMSALIAERFGKLWKAVAVAVEGSDPEGVHDVRVASRRLRAAMDVAVECFPEPWYRKLHRKAKWITAELGFVRDTEVLLAFFRDELEQASPEERPGIELLVAQLTDALEESRRSMHEELSELLASGLAEESARRFGPAAAAPRSEDD